MVATLTGLIGYPVEHSLSPRIHDYWIREHRIDAEYKLFTTPPARVRQVVKRLRDKGAVGFNITVPHKQAVMEFLDGVDETATRIGAVNTVIRDKNRFIGTNTDGYGFITHLKEGVSGTDFLNHAMLLGAGGATRAAIVSLIDAGAKQLTLTNRTRETAQGLAEEFSGAGVTLTVAPWEERHAMLKDASLLVNTTSLGMVGKSPLEIDLSALPKSAIVHDIVYAPLETELLKNARLRGHPVVDGLGMLLYQAQAAFEAWHGVKPAVTQALRDHVLAEHVCAA